MIVAKENPNIESPLTLVVGGTGHLGGEIVRLLHEARVPVRAALRDGTEALARAKLAEHAVEAVAADLKEPASLAALCRGVDTVVSTATSLLSRRPGDTIAAVDDAGQRALVDAASAAGVRRFVFVSFPPTPVDSAFQRAKRAVEERLLGAGMAYTILQASAFMEVWLGPALGFEPLRGRVRLPGTGQAPVSWISLRDVARFARAAVSDERFANRVLPLGGPDPLSPNQVVDIFEELTASRIERELVPEAAIAGMLAAATDPVAEAMAAQMLTVARGQVVEPTPALELLPGRLISVRDYASRLVRQAAAET